MDTKKIDAGAAAPAGGIAISERLATKESIINAVAVKLHDRAGATRKIHYLFNSAHSAYLRVNFLTGPNGLTESYWVEVKNGVINVSSEVNTVFHVDRTMA